MNLPLLKGCAIMGVFWGAFFRNEPELNAKNFETIVEWFDSGKLKPVIHKQYKLEQIADAMNELTTKKVMGKIVLTP